MKQLSFNFNETITEKYQYAIKYAKEHIDDLEKIIKHKDNLLEDTINQFIEYREDKGEDERTATRKVYQLIYDEKWKNYISDRDGDSFLTIEEGQEWFDDNHDDWFCSSPYDMSFLDLMNHELDDIGLDQIMKRKEVQHAI